MNHSFDIDLATKYGVSEAIFIENLRFWIAKNKANKKHFYKGRYWTYNTMQAFAELFPYWSVHQVRRILERLQEAGVLLTDNFNPNPYDRTVWYAFSDQIDMAETPDTFGKSAKSLISTDINTDSSTPTEVQQKDALFDIFWKAYPRKTNKEFAKKVFAKLKVDEPLLNKLLSALQLQAKGWTDPQFIPHASTWLNGKRWEDEVTVAVETLTPLQKAMRGAL